MTAEEVALEEFREAVRRRRILRRDAKHMADMPIGQSFWGMHLETRKQVRTLARIIRAIRRENRGDRMRASYEASVSEQVIHAETAWYDRGYEQGRRDALRGVQGACWYLHGNLWLNRFPLPSSDERRAIAAIEIAMQAKAAEEMTR